MEGAWDSETWVGVQTIDSNLHLLSHFKKLYKQYVNYINYLFQQYVGIELIICIRDIALLADQCIDVSPAVTIDTAARRPEKFRDSEFSLLEVLKIIYG